MKRQARIFFLTALAAISSCSRNDVGETDTSYDIIYEVMLGTSTRTDGVTANDYPSDVPFGVWAYTLPKEKSWETAGEEAVPVMDNIRSEHISGRQWRPENGQKWGTAGENMNFFAAAPYGRASFSIDGGIRIDSYSLEENLSLMFVGGVLNQDRKASKGHVAMTFTRPLTNVSFRAQMSLPEGYSVTAKKLTLSNIVTEGSFTSAPSPRWTGEGEPEDVVFFEGEIPLGETPMHLCRSIAMIPQTAATEMTLICDIGNGTGVLADQPLKARFNMGWGVGKHCSYTLKVTQNLEFTAEKDPN